MIDKYMLPTDYSFKKAARIYLRRFFIFIAVAFASLVVGYILILHFLSSTKWLIVLLIVLGVPLIYLGIDKIVYDQRRAKHTYKHPERARYVPHRRPGGYEPSMKTMSATRGRSDKRTEKKIVPIAVGIILALLFLLLLINYILT